jgi:hypothetical protein
VRSEPARRYTSPDRILPGRKYNRCQEAGPTIWDYAQLTPLGAGGDGVSLSSYNSSTPGSVNDAHRGGRGTSCSFVAPWWNIRKVFGEAVEPPVDGDACR